MIKYVPACAIALSFLTAAAAILAWKLHPWMPAAACLELGRWKVGEYEFQIWQRKSASALEPFADGLFVRKGTNAWQAFCFDIQDTYRPKVELKPVGTEVRIWRDGELRGIFDLSKGIFFRPPSTNVFAPDSVGGDQNPPGSWRRGL
jgi:hypothetical protein